MTMGQTFGIVMIFVGLPVVLTATMVLFGALWPSALGRAEERIRSRPIVTFLTGLGVGVGGFLLTGALSALFAPIGLVAGTFLVLWAFFGMAAVARIAGARMTNTGDTPWKGHLRGSIALSLAAIVPPVPGWVFILPVAVLLGLGSATLQLFTRRKAVPTSEPAPAPKIEEKAEMLA